MFSILNEAKLTTDDRKKLNDNVFGLPDERKYPLNDEEHVRKAIQFFKFCPTKNRSELAKNINKRIKDLDMKVSVGEKNPFYKYANKAVITTEGMIPETFEDSTSCLFTDVRGLMTNITSITDISEIEKKIHHNLVVTDWTFNDLEVCNAQMYIVYRAFCDYYRYTTNVKCGLFHRVIRDIFGSSNLTLDMCIKVIYAFSKLENCNWWVIYRELCENNSTPGNLFDTEICTYDIVKNTMGFNETVSMIPDDVVMNMLNVNDLVSLIGQHSIDYLKQETDNITNELINNNMPIFMDRYTKVFCPIKLENKRFTLTDGDIDLYYLEKIYPYIKFQPNAMDTIKAERFCDKMNLSSPIRGMDVNGQMFLFTYNDGVNSIIGFNRKHVSYLYIIPLSDDVIIRLSSDIGQISAEDIPLKKYRFVEKNSERNISLTEGISVDEVGNVKLTLSPKKSYMDEYMENHRLLKENYKNKNMEGVKQNLAYAFALINIIERTKEYKQREKEIVKARAFLINDFKTYLSKLQKVEPDFDFVSYYNKSELDKLVVDVPVETITGIKKLFKIIMMS